MTIGNKRKQKQTSAVPSVPLHLELLDEKALRLTQKEQNKLRQCERLISQATRKITDGFREMAGAFYEIRERRLYRQTHPTFEAYFQEKWGYARSHANRIADAGSALQRLSPHGDILNSFDSEAHFRPLLTIKDEDTQERVIDTLEEWKKWIPNTAITPGLVRAATAFVQPPARIRSGKHDEKAKLVDRFASIVEQTRIELPKNTSTDVRKLFDKLAARTAALKRPRASTGIAWTEATWNPLEGCAHVSKGCDRCYAAKLIATRMAHRYPGLAVAKTAKDGTKRYFFTNTILLQPHDLAQPLHELTPKRFFVNSMSDLFHEKVPNAFIEAVFEVMEKAYWHQFQVLTKRPDRMAAFTQKYFASKNPPSNIWLGTSTEDQEAFNDRVEHLRLTKAAVRWLSCEPLLGPIKLDKRSGIDWVVVGGESDSTRRMDRAWAASLRDQCTRFRIPFFFKQWGSYAEDGTGPRREPHNPPPALDGVIHHKFPETSANLT